MMQGWRRAGLPCFGRSWFALRRPSAHFGRCRGSRIRRHSPAAVAILALLCVVWGPAGQTASAATAAEVDKAIKAAKDYLYSQVKKDNWEEVPLPDPKGKPADPAGKQWGGYTSMAIYALLAAGENPQDVRLAPAIDWVKKQKIEGNYALGMRAQIWPFLPDSPQRRGLAQRDADQLFRAMRDNPAKDKDGFGFYGYYSDAKGPQGGWDLSVSQYGVLGMWACEQADAEVPIKYWETIDAAWRGHQFKEKDGPDDNGGWAYHRGSSSADQGRPRRR